MARACVFRKRVGRYTWGMNYIGTGNQNNSMNGVQYGRVLAGSVSDPHERESRAAKTSNNPQPLLDRFFFLFFSLSLSLLRPQWWNILVYRWIHIIRNDFGACVWLLKISWTGETTRFFFFFLFPLSLHQTRVEFSSISSVISTTFHRKKV